MIASKEYKTSRKEDKSVLVVNYDFRSDIRGKGTATKMMVKERMRTCPRWKDDTEYIYHYLVSRGFYGGKEGVFEDVKKERKITVKRKIGLRMRITAEAWGFDVPIEKLLNKEEVDRFIVSGNLPTKKSGD